jgi:hypothetical protein
MRIVGPFSQTYLSCKRATNSGFNCGLQIGRLAPLATGLDGKHQRSAVAAQSLHQQSQVSFSIPSNSCCDRIQAASGNKPRGQRESASDVIQDRGHAWI